MILNLSLAAFHLTRCGLVGYEEIFKPRENLHHEIQFIFNMNLATPNMIFGMTYYLDLHGAISFCY